MKSNFFVGELLLPLILLSASCGEAYSVDSMEEQEVPMPNCTRDSDCVSQKFCSSTKRCVNCFDCSDWNRKLGPDFSGYCVKSLEKDCGNCMEGYISDFCSSNTVCKCIRPPKREAPIDRKIDVTLLPQKTDVDLKILVPALLIFVIAGSSSIMYFTGWKIRHSSVPVRQPREDPPEYRQSPEFQVEDEIMQTSNPRSKNTSVGGFVGACETQSLITQVRGREEADPAKASAIRPPCNDLVAENRRPEPSAPPSQDMLDSEEDANASGLEYEDIEGQAPEEIPAEITPPVGKIDRLIYWVSRFLKREHNFQLANSRGHEQGQSTPRDHQNRVSPQNETSATALLENRQLSNANEPFDGNAVQSVARMVHRYIRDLFRKSEVVSNDAIELQEVRVLRLGNTRTFNTPPNEPTFDSSEQLPVVPIIENHCSACLDPQHEPQHSTLDMLAVETRGNRENTSDMLAIDIRGSRENIPTTYL